MKKKPLLVTLALVALAGLAAYMMMDWLRPAPIQVECLIRRAQPSRRPQPAAESASGRPGYNVSFAFNRKVALTAIRVYPLQEALTNKHPHAIWNLQSVSNAVPTKSLVYGGWVRGMQPVVKGAMADPLEAGSSYRLVVEAGDGKVEKDFQMP
jgi:hypothetical protein